MLQHGKSEGKANNTFFTRIDANESGFGGWVMSIKLK